MRAPNAGLYTLSGTNTWLVGRDPAYLIDPGPAIPAHLDALALEIDKRGGLAAILVTHDHHDHGDAAAPLRALSGAPVAAMRADADIALADGDAIGPIVALATPGHASDHLSFVYGRVCFSGDSVLGEGSVFIAAGPGSLAGYLAALRRLRELELELIAPGHGPLIEEPNTKIDEYIDHRRRREQLVLDALADGLRERSELLDRVWGELPPALLPIARSTLEAHLGKLAEEGRLPPGLAAG
ncbi:MAG TPA: MBL fold metallo-hydrolase [Solirubrobacteraceae bacterium]|nr:MBL fold metallo-hydrolase [Solirubrobacteraceae bacterium]